MSGWGAAQPWKAQLRRRMFPDRANRVQAPWGKALLAVASFGVALGVRIALDRVLPPGFPFLTFFPAVVATSYFAGWRAGSVCAVLSGIAAWYFFIPPFETFVLNSATAVALGFFVMVAAVMIVALHRMQVSLDRLDAQRVLAAELIEQQRTMFQELQHRIANNMMFVSSVLQLHRREAVKAPERALMALDNAQQRIQVMSRIHRRLYDPSSVDRPVDQYFRDMCNDLIEAAGARNIAVRVEMPDMRLDITRLMTLSLIVTELVTNSLKHAFVGRERGAITVSLSRPAADTLELIVADDGTGIVDPAVRKPGSGLGSLILEALATQIGGKIELDGSTATGTKASVVFDAQSDFSLA